MGWEISQKPLQALHLETISANQWSIDPNLWLIRKESTRRTLQLLISQILLGFISQIPLRLISQIPLGLITQILPELTSPILLEFISQSLAFTPITEGIYKPEVTMPKGIEKFQANFNLHS
jgi:hypothetical protein